VELYINWKDFMKLRKWHRWIGLAITLPLILITFSGIVLQLRNQFEYIQPTSIKSEISVNTPLITLESAQRIAGNEKIEQIVFRPEKGNLSIRLTSGEELQIDPHKGNILKRAMRRTSLLIDLHQGTWLGKFGQYFIHLLSGLGLATLIITGLFIYPFKRQKFYEQ
jgi:uncharacterized iron-regulated membrane protein